MANINNLHKVKAGELSHLDFLKSSKEWNNYVDWCQSHNVDVDDSSAEFYFDQTFSTEYDENEVYMEVYP